MVRDAKNFYARDTNYSWLCLSHATLLAMHINFFMFARRATTKWAGCVCVCVCVSCSKNG